MCIYLTNNLAKNEVIARKNGLLPAEAERYELFGDVSSVPSSSRTVTVVLQKFAPHMLIEARL